MNLTILTKMSSSKVLFGLFFVKNDQFFIENGHFCIEITPNNLISLEGQDLVAELTRTESSTGRFVAPEGGSYLNMKRIQQIQIKEGLHNFVSELKKIAGFKKNPPPQPRPILIGVGSSSLDVGPCEKLQKYLLESGIFRVSKENQNFRVLNGTFRAVTYFEFLGCTLVNDSEAKLVYPHPKIHFQFFDCSEQECFRFFTIYPI